MLDRGDDERLCGELQVDPDGDPIEFSGTLELLAALERLRRHDVARSSGTATSVHTDPQESVRP